MKPARALALLLAGCALFGCGNTHPLKDGTYAFTRASVIRDDCGQADRPELMSGGVLQTHGNEVRLDTGFYEIKLIGVYLSGTESMRLDGSAANVSTIVQGRECLLDLLVLSIEASTLDPDRFAGSLSARYEAERPVDCDCQTWVQFSATRVP